MEFIRFRDTFNQWVRVSHEDIIRFDYAMQIESPETRISSTWVYLHDVDVEGFIDRVNAAGHTVHLTDHEVENRSSVVHLPAYRADLLMIIPYRGRTFRFHNTGVEDDRFRVVEERYTNRSATAVLERVRGEAS